MRIRKQTFCRVVVSRSGSLGSNLYCFLHLTNLQNATNSQCPASLLPAGIPMLKSAPGERESILREFSVRSYLLGYSLVFIAFSILALQVTT